MEDKGVQQFRGELASAAGVLYRSPKVNEQGFG